jgi:hypothetical protein
MFSSATISLSRNIPLQGLGYIGLRKNSKTHVPLLALSLSIRNVFKNFHGKKFTVFLKIIYGNEFQLVCCLESQKSP